MDLGGTKTEVLVLNEYGEECLRQRWPTPEHRYEVILQHLHDCIASVCQSLQLAADLPVGFGTPGAISPRSGCLRNSNTQCLNGQPLLADLQQKLQRPVRIENDANCFALSEAVDGAAAGFEIVFGVIIGTGTGGGLVINQRPRTGPHAIGGEWGHNPLPWPGAEDQPLRPCFCGHHGCIETWLSGPGQEADFQQRFGRRLSSREIVMSAENGDRDCQFQMQLYHQRLARALSHVINIIDPDCIVLGGGMSNIPSLYEALPQLLQQQVFSDFFATPIRPPVHGDSSGVRGAAWLWREE